MTYTPAAAFVNWYYWPPPRFSIVEFIGPVTSRLYTAPSSFFIITVEPIGMVSVSGASVEYRITIV